MGELFKKKETTVEANLLTKENAEAVALWCGGTLVDEISPHTPTDKYVGINVPTLHGPARASEGDWIIQGEQGDFWPCKPGNFQSSYEPLI